MTLSFQNTRHSLLRRATDLNDQSAWNELSQHYERFIYYLLEQLGVTSCDIDDLAQQTLIALMENLPKYDRERERFRTWLKQVIRDVTITHFHIRDGQELKINQLAGQSVTESSEQTAEIDQLIEDEWETYVTNIAMERVKQNHQGHALEVFELDLKGIPTVSIATLLGMNVPAVQAFRKRIKRSLLLEVRSVIRELEG